ncbi:SRPBCC family protein [Desertivirga arenae]|uniref:SRPBCC family protein n=1 Tax=Desertivirga arenae TaxID=2810309 RepID=UPI001A96FD7C|nr:SRPBCC domain-containing protein [Pedobacter sp. SYSU D00823]
MKTVESIKRTLTLNAPKEKVWEVLTKDEYTREWYKEFSEGSHAKSDWREGSKITFQDLSGQGIIGVITVLQPHEHLEFRYNGILNKGVEDFESEEAVAVKGFKELYLIKETDGVCTLKIESDMNEEYVQMMEEAWDRALKVLKTLAEG